MRNPPIIANMPTPPPKIIGQSSGLRGAEVVGVTLGVVFAFILSLAWWYRRYRRRKADAKGNLDIPFIGFTRADAKHTFPR